MKADHPLPGSDGEHILQQTHGTTVRAENFYRKQMLDHLNYRMRLFIERMEMMFVSTSDRQGNCDCSIRCGDAGFVHLLNERQIAYPEYRGNGVMASLGNITENAHVGLLFIDFFRDCVGLHVNGEAKVVEAEQFLKLDGLAPEILQSVQQIGGRKPERWVIVDVHEAYIHCAKHLPMLVKTPKKIHWGTDDPAIKGGDYFGVAADAEEAIHPRHAPEHHPESEAAL